MLKGEWHNYASGISMTDCEASNRNAAIYERRLNDHLSLAAISAEFNISRQRVSQICRDIAVKTKDDKYLSTDWRTLAGYHRRKPRMTFECPVCNRQLQETHRVAHKRKFCSRPCSKAAWQKYNRQTYDMLLAARKEGKSWIAIGEATGLKTPAQTFFVLKQRYG